MAKITVQDTSITIIKIEDTDYISLTDIARHKTDDTFIVVCNWQPTRNAIKSLSIRGSFFPPDFKPLEFDRFRKEAGLAGEAERRPFGGASSGQQVPQTCDKAKYTSFLTRTYGLRCNYGTSRWTA